MCRHITTVYRCTKCNDRIITDNITCDAPWYKRLARQACDNMDWTVVEDPCEKLCTSCAERRCNPKATVREPRRPVVLDIPSPVLEESSVFGPFSEFNAYTAQYVNGRLDAWLKRHFERAASPRTSVDLTGAMSRLDIDAENAAGAGDSGSSSDTGETGSTEATEAAASTCMLFTNAQTHSPEEIVDKDGFEKQKVTGGIKPGSCWGGLVEIVLRMRLDNP